MCTTCENIQIANPATNTAAGSEPTASAFPEPSDASRKLTVHGMTCASCATKVSSAVEQVPGVTGTEVDLATGALRVRGADVDLDAVRGAVTAAGYHVT